MRVSLVPDRLFETYEEITPEYLRQRGIRLLLSDLDYTLAPKYVPHPDDRVREWLRRMEEGGVQVMILSNNRSSHRVETFCRELGIPYVGHAQKPRTTGFHRAMKQVGVTAAETAMMGDKLLPEGRRAHGTGCSTPCRRPLRPSAAAVTHKFRGKREKIWQSPCQNGTYHVKYNCCANS